MLIPIPGMVHLKVVVPDPPRTPPRPPAVDKHRLTLATSLSQKALDVACGMRPLVHIDKRRYASPVRLYLAARLKASRVRGPVRIRTITLKHDTEVFGTAVCAGRIFAFTARLSESKPERLLTFRDLVTPG